MTTQAELPLFRRPRREPAEDLGKLLSWLHDRGWRTAGEIEGALGFSDRYIRRLASESKGHIISGQEGYKLTREATIEEIGHSVAFLRSQAHEMNRRSIEIERIYHGRA